MQVTLIRGLPGSGKSTLARSFNILHLEADMYHMRNGEYKWNPNAVSAAHTWCFNSYFHAIQTGFDVVVSNTFTRLSEFEKYIEAFNTVKKEGDTLRVLRTFKNFSNIHSVPEETLKKMAERFENFEGEIIV